MKKFISLDIGGTNTRFALITEDYQIEKMEIRPTVGNDVSSFISSIVSIIRDNISSRQDIIGISIGVPGPIDKFSSLILALPNVGKGLHDIDLWDALVNEFHLPVIIQNDANAAVLAESCIGEHAKYKSVFFITISTGIGGAYAEGKDNSKSPFEIGHTLYKYKDKEYELEKIASGTGIVKLCELNGVSISNAKEFFNLVKDKDERIIPIYKDWLNLIANFINDINDKFHPEIFTFTGGVMKSADVFFDDLKKMLPHLKLEKCFHEQNAGLLGTAVAGFNY